MYPTKQIPNGLPKTVLQKPSCKTKAKHTREIYCPLEKTQAALRNLSYKTTPGRARRKCQLKAYHKACSRNRLSIPEREILSQAKGRDRRNTWCISRSRAARMGQKNRSGATRYFESVPKIKRGGAKHRPAHKPLLLLQNCSASLRRTEPCGPLHGGGREPYGRWKMPFSGGSHEPWNDDDGWADRYASCGTPPSCVSSMLDSRIRLQQSIVSDHR